MNLREINKVRNGEGYCRLDT